jgi:hypothetical protein
MHGHIKVKNKRYHLEDLGVDGRMLLKWILRCGMGRHGLDSCGLE